MTLSEYEQAARRTANEEDANKQLLNCCLGLSGETGEFNDMVKKHVFHGHPLDRTKVIKELGDTLWYLTIAASTVGSSLEEVASLNVEKLKKRYPEGFSVERSLNREKEDA